MCPYKAYPAHRVLGVDFEKAWHTEPTTIRFSKEMHLLFTVARGSWSWTASKHTWASKPVGAERRRKREGKRSINSFNSQFSATHPYPVGWFSKFSSCRSIAHLIFEYRSRPFSFSLSLSIARIVERLPLLNFTAMFSIALALQCLTVGRC